MSDILVKCPNCSKHLAVDDQAAGKSVPCRDCGNLLYVPSGDTAFHCPSCAWDMTAPASNAGDTFDCPKCGRVFVIPQPPRLSDLAVQGYLREYEQCAESYRQTYATIWQAGAVCIALSAAWIAIGKGQAGIESMPYWFKSTMLLPVLFWWVGIFLPMERYAEQRSTRLGKIESELNRNVTGLHMRHFQEYNELRRGKKVRPWEWTVKEIVNPLCFTAGLIEVVLLLIPFLHL
jgi:ribosomal protein S27E